MAINIAELESRITELEIRLTEVERQTISFEANVRRIVTNSAGDIVASAWPDVTNAPWYFSLLNAVVQTVMIEISREGSGVLFDQFVDWLERRFRPISELQPIASTAEIVGEATMVETTVSPNGQVTTINSDGTRVTVDPNGETVTVHPNGDIVHTYPDGRVLTLYPDGRSEWSTSVVGGTVELIEPEEDSVEIAGVAPKPITETRLTNSERFLSIIDELRTATEEGKLKLNHKSHDIINQDFAIARDKALREIMHLYAEVTNKIADQRDAAIAAVRAAQPKQSHNADNPNFQTPERLSY